MNREHRHAHIVLVCVGVFQEYILLNIAHVLRLGHTNLSIITNHRFFQHFGRFKTAPIKLINADTFDCHPLMQLDAEFRNGFWVHTSMRFFYLYEYMRNHSLESVVHIENDVLIYYNADVLVQLIPDNNRIYLPFDSYNRSIASIVYIPNHVVLHKVLQEYDGKKNDMENFALIRKKQNTECYIDNLPIFPQGLMHTQPTDAVKAEMEYTCRNYEHFGGFIFDAAAMGQYLGGVDKRNDSGNTVGFINETCVIKYGGLKFVWKNVEGVARPYLKIEELEYPIFNLHIHSKQLHDFTLHF